ncbi:endonuclease [Lysinibacillus fusiformis]|uniref:endonuclease n=1 Tax=Lysinibacillus fusiformis TaxID=28031 RepID=UPI001F4DE43F|nr:endonuclease [Lysinibacillus fusiformis]MCK1989226.1 endonuclease [Lysinibacillus fusiformis]
MKQEEFIELAGGVFKSNKNYNDWGSNDKYENFWAFFESDYKYVKSVYSGISIEVLRQKKLHSIEHIFPKSIVKKYLELKNQERTIVYGSTTNPLNFVAEHRSINEHRGHLPFDIENDTAIRRNIRLETPTYYTDWGRDHENEWVVPHVSRGNVARTMLYMFLVYNVQELFKEHLNSYIYWCKSDPPTQWELEYNQWVFEKHKIKNPFVTDDITQLVNLLDDKELFNKLLVENRL